MSWQAQAPIFRLIQIGSLSRLDKYERFILIMLASFADLEGQGSRPSQATLAMDTHMSIPYVKRAMMGLKAKLGPCGLLSWLDATTTKPAEWDIDLTLAEELIVRREQELCNKYLPPKSITDRDKIVQQAVRRYRQDVRDSVSAKRRRELRAENAQLMNVRQSAA